MPQFRVDFRNAPMRDLTELWNAYYPPAFRIDEHLLCQNTVDSGLFDWGASAIQMEDGTPVGFVAIKKSAARLYAGPDQDQFHLCAIAYKDTSVGVDLLAYAKRTLRIRGASKLVFGQDSRHFFPGYPVAESPLGVFLLVEGFSDGGESFDLERDLQHYANPARPVTGVEFRPTKESDQPSLARFFAEEFPGRWQYDVFQKARVEGHTRAVFGMFVDGEVQGFALVQQDGDRMPIGGASWHLDLGLNWGSLGPIGISSKLRGRGYGDALLGAALTHLRDLGVRKCIIDWTGLVDFYRRHGFVVTRTYRSAVLNFEEPVAHRN